MDTEIAERSLLCYIYNWHGPQARTKTKGHVLKHYNICFSVHVPLSLRTLSIFSCIHGNISL